MRNKEEQLRNISARYNESIEQIKKNVRWWDLPRLIAIQQLFIIRELSLIRTATYGEAPWLEDR